MNIQIEKLFQELGTLYVQTRVQAEEIDKLRAGVKAGVKALTDQINAKSDAPSSGN